MYDIKLIRYQSDDYSFLNYKLLAHQKKFTHELDYLINVRCDLKNIEKSVDNKGRIF